MQVSRQELKRRREKVKEEIEKRDLSAICLFIPHNIFYLTNFSFIPTERPIVLIWAFKFSPILFIPLLEIDHVREASDVEFVAYPEYPDERHPIHRLADLLYELGLENKKVGVDSDGYAGGYGYRGPKLSRVFAGRVVEIGDIIERIMWIKSPEEIALLRESAKWANLALCLVQKYSQPGRYEIDISILASHEASLAMVETLGSNYQLTHTGFPVNASFRGQIGPRSAIPHSLPANICIRKGDILIAEATANVGGYRAELERTMIVGEPTEKQKQFFGLMLAAQELALEQIRPGRKCSDVDRAVRDFYAEQKISKYWRHHTGHALGIRVHEAPFLDIGDSTIIQPGMVFSVEPGIYIPGFGGFRHSDTVVVTENGCERITYYPRNVESLTIT